MPDYNASYPDGSQVKIASRAVLEEFQRTWKFHDKLTIGQLRYADSNAIVKSHGYYFGGTALYWLEDVPGTWHECCLLAASTLP
jgi:hypothetical protein